MTAFPHIRILWTPWQRVEVFNTLRQLERAGAIIEGKSPTLIRLLEQEVCLGYWPHAEFDWHDAIRTACELSAEHGLTVPIRRWIFSTLPSPSKREQARS